MKKRFHWILIVLAAGLLPVFTGAMGNVSGCVSSDSNTEFLNLFLTSQNGTLSWHYQNCQGGIGGNGTVRTCNNFVPDKLLSVSGEQLRIKDKTNCDGIFGVKINILNMWGRTGFIDDAVETPVDFKFQGPVQATPCSCDPD